MLQSRQDCDHHQLQRQRGISPASQPGAHLAGRANLDVCAVVTLQPAHKGYRVGRERGAGLVDLSCCVERWATLQEWCNAMHGPA